MGSNIRDDLVDLIGHASAIELLRGFGGRRLKIPANLSEDHALVFCVGWDAARKLAAAYGGAEPLDLPAERNFLIDLRNDAMMARFRAGASIAAISREYGVSRRHVNSVLDRMGAREERMARAAGGRT